MALKYAIAAALFLALPAPALATEDVACQKLPAEWQQWVMPSPAPADRVLVPGRAYTITLAPMAEVALEGFDGKELPEGSRGAVFTLVVERTGTYRVAVGDPMWIDLLDHTGPVESVAHGHGPECTGIAKIVDFTLKEGGYRLELSAAEVPASALMVLGPVD